MRPVCLLVFAAIFIAKHSFSNNTEDSILIKIWDKNTGVYENYGFTKNYVSSNCLRVDSTSLYQYSQQQSQWVPLFTIERSFNASNLKTEELYKQGIQRTNFGRVLFNYQSVLLTDSIEQKWNITSGQYQNERRTLIKRRQDNKPDTVLIQIWNDTDLKWENFRREVISYASGSGLSEVTVLLQNWIFNAWTNSQQAIAVYEESANIKIEETRQIWNTTTSAWNFAERTTIKHNTQKKPIYMITEDYNSTTLQWDSSSRIFIDYNGKYTTTNRQSYNTVSSSWENFYIITQVSACDFNTSLMTQKSLSLKFYPNPASSSIFIETDNLLSVRLYDLQGRLLITKSMHDELKSVDVSSLSSGSYLLEIQIKNEKPTMHRIVKL